MHRALSRRVVAPLLACAFLPVSSLVAQELPYSGVHGVDLVYATDPGGVASQLYAVAPAFSLAPIPIGNPVGRVPSRWAHRRTTLGALETKITYASAGLLMTPMGSTVGTGGIHLVDGRILGVSVTFVATGNPAGYDLALDESRQYVFSAEDDGLGGTTLRGFSYATPGTLAPLSPPTLTLSGSPSSYVQRIGVDEATGVLHVPTVDGVHVVALQGGAPQMSLSGTVFTAPFVPTTNPTSFVRGGTQHWMIGTSRFDLVNAPVEAGWQAWDNGGASFGGAGYGAVPTAPGKNWVPAAGTEELAVVTDGADAYAYYLLREPPPGTFFIKPSAIGVTRFVNGQPPVTSTILCPNECGEPFANPMVSGTRIALESSLGMPFISEPPGGAEKISILYTPLDPLGVASPDGVLAVAGPLGGRISTKGLERPLWTRDGTRVVATTSHFPGAPNPGMPGIEVLDVFQSLPVNTYTNPHVVVQNPTSPNRSIVFPSLFQPRDPGAAAFLAPFSFVGNVFHDGMASIMTLPWGEIGQKQPDAFLQSAAVPNFPAILPPSFQYAIGASTPPSEFGARRTTFNLFQLDLTGLIMTAAVGDRILVQPTGNNFLATVGLSVETPPIPFALNPGWITTTEFLSL